MNVKMFGEICDAFGPSGFEEDVIRTVAKYCKGLELENDAMNNLYARMPGEDPEKPVVMLDAHTDECGFMVQSIRENGSLDIMIPFLKRILRDVEFLVLQLLIEWLLHQLGIGIR